MNIIYYSRYFLFYITLRRIQSLRIVSEVGSIAVQFYLSVSFPQYAGFAGGEVDSAGT